MIKRTTQLLAVVTVLLLGLLLAGTAVADHIPNPTSVTIAGSFQDELGCPGDWHPECATTHLTYDATDDIWQGTFNVAAGAQEYKAALNDTWDVAFPGGNVSLTGANNPVKFYYDHKTHFVSDSTRLIIVAVGNWQQEICSRCIDIEAGKRDFCEPGQKVFRHCQHRQEHFSFAGTGRHQQEII